MSHARLMGAVLVALAAAGLWLLLERFPVRPPPLVDAGPITSAEDAARGPTAPDAAGSDAWRAEDSPAEHAFSPGWIGAACAHDADCDYEGGFCLLTEEGFPRGYCSHQCDRFCPDRAGDLYSTTFCIVDPTYGEDGICAAQCNMHLTTSGCRPDYICATVLRREEETVRMVCLPERGTPAPSTACTRALDEAGLSYTRPDLADDPTRAARKGGPGPREEICQIDTPVLLASPVAGVDYRRRGKRHAEHMLVSCEMALVIGSLSEVLAEAGVVEVEHFGTYSCRSVAGTRTLSGHGRARAIDVSGFERAHGAPVDLKRDWFGPDDEKRRYLRKVTSRISRARLFDSILTPESDSAHADHLHLEIR